MKNNNPKIILTLFSIIIGIFIAIQMKLNVESYAPVTLSSIQIMKDQISAINNETMELKEEIKNKEEKLDILDNISKGDDNIIQIFKEDIKNNKIHSGQLSLEGPGIMIKMYDNPEERMAGFDINDDVIHDLDILNIINDLRVAGAEAISINGERVVSTSEIKCAGPTIRVNGRSSGSPFVIRAIGDQKLLSASVNAPGTYGEILKTVYQIGFDASSEDSLIIPAYSGNFSFKYAKQLEEGD